MTAPFVPVVDAAASAALDAAAIAGGTPSRALMQRAGAAAAAELSRRCADRLGDGVLVLAGAGNNGGDGWVIARALLAAGTAVRVLECAAARTPDAIAERAFALEAGVSWSAGVTTMHERGERIIVDALLGTGLRGDEPLDAAMTAATQALRQHAGGSTIVAVDVPSGLDASTGRDAGCAPAGLTLTFGSVKRGHLVARDKCGEVVVLDIGLNAGATGVARLCTPAWFREALPSIAFDAHKGTRGHVAIVGGAEGMAGAVVLAARAALRSGAGLVKCLVAPGSLAAVQQGEPAALAAAWPADDAALAHALGDWADVVLIGPGMGRASARTIVERVLRIHRGPVVLDADALNAFEGDADALQPLLAGREALLTPHPAEFARLAGISVPQVLDARFTAPAELARRTGATVLLKGTPTVIASPSGAAFISAEGTPILATGGAGDVLGGICATLLAQKVGAHVAGALGAFAHGRAAHTVAARQVRGYVLDDVLAVLPEIWSMPVAVLLSPVLAELPAVGEG